MEQENNQNENKKNSQEKNNGMSHPRDISKQNNLREYCIANGIPTRDTTHLHIGETSIMFSSTNKEAEDDSAAATIRYLNLRKGQ